MIPAEHLRVIVKKMSVMAFPSTISRLQGLYYRWKLFRSIALDLYEMINRDHFIKEAVHVIAESFTKVSGFDVTLQLAYCVGDLLKALDFIAVFMMGRKIFYYFCLFFYLNRHTLLWPHKPDRAFRDMAEVSLVFQRFTVFVICKQQRNFSVQDMLTSDQKQFAFSDCWAVFHSLMDPLWCSCTF